MARSARVTAVLGIELPGLAVGGEGAGAVEAGAEAAAELVVLQDPAELAVGGGELRFEADGPPRLLARGIAHAAGEQGAGDPRAGEGLAGRRRRQALELRQRLAHPAGVEVSLAGLVEEQERDLVLPRLAHARPQGLELRGGDAALAGVEPEGGGDGVAVARGVLLRQGGGAEMAHSGRRAAAAARSRRGGTIR